MRKKKNDIDFEYNEETEELIFNEEVKEKELHSKIGVDDHIYVKKFFGGPLLVVLGVILVLTSLFSLLYGLFTSDSDLNGRRIGVFHTQYKLLVSHSNSEYGGTISSFSEYATSPTAYVYEFKVSNSNPVKLDYGVKFLSDGDNNGISYQLVKNDQIVKRGLLGKDKKIDLYDTSIDSGMEDKYEIRLWSDTNNSIKDYSFKINIEV